LDAPVLGQIPARVPGGPDALLPNPFGLAFDEITASSLVRSPRADALRRHLRGLHASREAPQSWRRYL